MAMLRALNKNIKQNLMDFKNGTVSGKKHSGNETENTMNLQLAEILKFGYNAFKKYGI